jgi:hypothetical protein
MTRFRTFMLTERDRKVATGETSAPRSSNAAPTNGTSATMVSTIPTQSTRLIFG